MKCLHPAIAIAVASTMCNGSPVPPTLQSASQQPDKQTINTSGLLPVIALSYLQEVANAFREAKSNISRFGRVFAFSFANLPIDFDGSTLKIPTSSGKVAPSELGSLHLDMDGLDSSMSATSDIHSAQSEAANDEGSLSSID
ncbi:hypothetical protein GGI09_002912 [Coemansia sp. S100]|nr:hypothetical protein GGI14_000497 [Coemansia sp. S680]KAJ2099198.1 hypothetical protein GGI09_002912 [Coemansia sp. S100]